MTRVVVLIALFMALAAGCGGGGDSEASGAPPDEYASDVCGALTAWQQQLQESAQDAGANSGNAGDLDAVKSRLVDFMDEAATSTDELIEKVDAAGPPAVENGEKVHADLKKGLTAAKSSFEQAKASAEKLDADNPASFQTAAQDLGTTLGEQGTKIQNAFSALESRSSPELNEAFDEEPACKDL